MKKTRQKFEFVTRRVNKYKHNWLWLVWLLCIGILVGLYNIPYDPCVEEVVYLNIIDEITFTIGLVIIVLIIVSSIIGGVFILFYWYGIRGHVTYRYEKICKNCRHHYAIETFDSVTKKVGYINRCNKWKERLNNMDEILIDNYDINMAHGVNHVLKNFKPCKYFKLKRKPEYKK